MKRALLMCAVAIPTVVASTMAAAVPGDEWYITPQVGGISPDHQRDLRHNDWLYGGQCKCRITPGHKTNNKGDTEKPTDK